VGIDIYLRWEGQTTEEEEAQYTGFSTGHGFVGYLREAYHGGPYATEVLFPETWDEENEGVASITNETLRERLPKAIEAALIRERTVYHDMEATEENCAMVKSLKDFVELHGKLEAEGRKPWILNSY
jgi:hypothetical protein